MLACTLDMVASRLFDASGCGDIHLDMLNFVRKKTPDIGGENIVLAVHIRRDGEEPAGEEAGTGGTGTAKAAGKGADEWTSPDTAGTAAGDGTGTAASAEPDRTEIPEA